MIEIVRHTRIDFMRLRKFALLLSGVLMVLGILGIIQVATGTANLGIDFAGGTAVLIKFEKPVSLEDVSSVI